MTSDFRLYLLDEVAEMTGLPSRALADAARAGKLPTHKMHGRHYMSASQISEYLARHITAPVHAPAQLSDDAAWEKFKAKRKRRPARSG